MKIKLNMMAVVLAAGTVLNLAAAENSPKPGTAAEVATHTNALSGDSRPLAVAWSQAEAVNLAPRQMIYASKVRELDGQNTLCLNAVAVKGAKQSGVTPCIAFTRIPVTPADFAAISFEYQGDGSPYFGSVLVGKDQNLLNGFEAQFPLNSTHWRRITLRRTDFINNCHPWDKTAKLSPADLTFAPTDIKYVGFGRGNCNYKYFTPKFTFSVRDIRLLTADQLPGQPVPAYSRGLNHTRELIKQKKPLNILMLGDSITDYGTSKSHGWHCAQLLQKTLGLPPGKVANAGIAGHSARAGTIVLPRSLRLMPNPDLVCIMYGANDCKAATGEFNQSGFTEDAFAQNLEMLIDQVRRATDGKADIILLSGVPRLNKNSGPSSGAVEKIVGAVQRTAAKRETAFCDTFPKFLALPAATKTRYYMDTIHQTQSGLAFIGQQLFKTIEAAVSTGAQP